MPYGSASDHAGGGSGNKGPAWVASIVNAIGQSSYWNNTAIVISWDEWGGWYDHVVPPLYADPGTGAYEGLGYRTPLIVVSPYARNHYVSKTQHDPRAPCISSRRYSACRLGPGGRAGRCLRRHVRFFASADEVPADSSQQKCSVLHRSVESGTGNRLLK